MNRTQQPSSSGAHTTCSIERKRVTAEVISCPGQLSDDTYAALQLNLEGFESPYVLTLTLRALGYAALSEQSDPRVVYDAIARAVNNAHVAVEVKSARSLRSRTE
jgi:hypothetical protein